MLPPVPPIDVHALMRGLVHELRNPLSAILTASSLLQSEQGIDEESAMLIGVVQKESRRMNGILTEFSSFVKPPKPHPETFDVALTLRELTHELKLDGALKNIEVRDDLPTQIWVHSDPVQSSQAFQHLLINAAQAMEDSGTLHLHASGNAQTAFIFLDDSGPGLSEEVSLRVFQPFFSTKPASTGLGLSIADGLLRASDGEVCIYNIASEPSTDTSTLSVLSGARVRVHLPRGAENSARI